MAAPRGSRERLVPGLSLHRGPDGVWRRFGPLDELLRITGPDAPVAAVEAWLQGGAGEDPGDAILDTARALGLLEPEPLPVPVGTRASVVGSGPVARELRRLLEAQGWRVDARTPVAEAVAADVGPTGPADGPTSEAPGTDVLGGTDVVVVVDDAQRDAAWTALDARLTAAGIPWHRAFREGRRWVVGPFWTATGDASYRDYRVRRLAADAQPDELEARWRAADAARPGTDAGEDPFAAVVAARIAHDVTALRDGRPVPGRDAEVLLDPATGALERHPVLALPPAPSA